MGTKENTKKAFALMMSTVMLAATGCEAIEISSQKAEQIVVHNLEEKYGGTFEVRSVEKKNKGVNAFKDHVYEMEVYSDELCETFTVEIYRNGENMADNYEEYFYRKQVTDEINSVLEEEDGWILERVEPSFSYYSNQKRSKDFDDYKRDEDKLVICIDIKIEDDTEEEKISATIFKYINTLQELGYRLAIDMYYKDEIETITVHNYDETVTKADVVGALENLGI